MKLHHAIITRVGGRELRLTYDHAPTLEEIDATLAHVRAIEGAPVAWNSKHVPKLATTEIKDRPAFKYASKQAKPPKPRHTCPWCGSHRRPQAFDPAAGKVLALLDPVRCVECDGIASREDFQS